MFTSFSRSWEMISQSYAVLKKQKTLVTFPILSGVACLLVAISFIAPMLAMPDLFQKLAKKDNDPATRNIVFTLTIRPGERRSARRVAHT